MPIAAHADTLAQREFAAVLHAKANTAHGAMLFQACAACHRDDGSGASDGTIPAIAAQHFRVVAGELIDYRHDKRWDERMAHFTDEHHLNSVQDVADVAAYVSGLRATRSLGQGRGEYLRHGAQVYGRQCASCHGAAAEGDNQKGYPRLAGQHYEYLLRQLHDAAEGRRPDFPRAHVRLLESFQLADFAGVADYLSRLGP